MNTTWHFLIIRFLPGAILSFPHPPALAVGPPIPTKRNLVKFSEQQLVEDNQYDLAFDGSNWHITRPLGDYWRSYSSNFDFIGTTSLAGATDLTGIDYSAALDQLIVADSRSGIVSFVNLDGSIASQVLTMRAIRGLDFDDRDSSIWFAFENRIHKWSVLEGPVFSFDADAPLPPTDRSGWTGVAIDTSTNRLFAMAEDNDSIHEFLFDGTYLGKLLDDPFTEGDAFERNGLGLHFDEGTSLLRVVNQKGDLLTYAVVPEPGLYILLIIMMLISVNSRMSYV